MAIPASDERASFGSERADYAESKVAALLDKHHSWLGREFHADLITMLKEAMRDQRHACAETIVAIDRNAWSRDMAYQAVMNAEVKP